MSKWNQFSLLLWKNYLIQKRKILLTLFEIGLPTFFGLILLLIRFRVETKAITHGVNWSNCGEFDVLPSNENIPKKLTYAPMFDFTTEIMERTKQRLNLTEGKNKTHKKVPLFKFLNLRFVYIFIVFTYISCVGLDDSLFLFLYKKSLKIPKG